MTPSRTFRLTSPQMHGDDVRDFQQLLNRRFAAWRIGRRVNVDSDYGKDTRDAAMQVCVGLGIVAATAMAHGVLPDLRTKVRHPGRRTPEEIERSRSAAAKRFRGQLRKHFAATDDEGVVIFDGTPVAAWLAPHLRFAREHGWTGVVTSGFRSCEHQKTVAADFAARLGKTVAQVYPNGPCASNHVGHGFPRGAVDVTRPEQLDHVLRETPHHPKLVWGGPVINDPVHFSATGH
jgi:hypothetical protein